MLQVSNSRTLTLNNAIKKTGECVVYVMSRDQRIKDNHALLAAQKKATELEQPLLVLFCLYSNLGYRAREHFEFMLEGLKSVEKECLKLNITFHILIGDPKKTLLTFNKVHKVSALYFDFSPLSSSRSLQKYIAKNFDCSVSVVDTHNIIPVWITSDKQEYAARTIRTKINKRLADWLDEPEQIKTHKYTWSTQPDSLTKHKSQIQKTLSQIASNKQQLKVTSGEVAAHSQLHNFINHRLIDYAESKNDPTIDALSGLSPYLHFGQVSSLRVALEINKKTSIDNSLKAGANVYLEELIVRKELSDNYCFYNPNYKSIKGAANWAQKTLAEHTDDPREFIYTYTELEDAKTHDEIWNAAQRQLVRDGKIHGYMRMYWAKKVLEWTKTPETAIKYLVQLNDFYHLDGGDPNGYVGIMWSVAGLHDRPWFNRPIFGTIRYMNDNGLKKKFDTDKYIKQNS